MVSIHAVLSTVRFGAEPLDRLRSAFGPAEFIQVSDGDERAYKDALERVDVAVIRGHVDDALLQAPRLRWVHCDHGGVDRSARPEVFRKGLLVTSSAGRSAPALAEHAFFFMLALAYRFPAFYEAQQARRWGIQDQGKLLALRGRTVGILGMGHIGVELARRCKAFDMRVLGYRRHGAAAPEGVDRLYVSSSGDSLQPILEESDFLVLTLPLSDATRGIIGANELARMKPSAFLINIARGGLVDEEALVEALRMGRIAGAGLDTFEREPLPADSPLWTAPQTLITPHFTPRLPDRTERSLEIIEENIRRYRNGQPLLNLLKAEDIYSGPGRPAKPAGKRAGKRSWLRVILGGGQ